VPYPGQQLRQEMPGMLGNVRQPNPHQRGRHARVILGRKRIVGGQSVVVKLPQLLHSLSEKFVVAGRSGEGPPNVRVAWDVIAEDHRDGAFRGRQHPLSRDGVVPQGHKAQNADRGREEREGRAPAPPAKEGPDDDCRDQTHSVGSDKRQKATEEARADRGSTSLRSFLSHQCQADAYKEQSARRLRPIAQGQSQRSGKQNHNSCRGPTGPSRRRQPSHQAEHKNAGRSAQELLKQDDSIAGFSEQRMRRGQVVAHGR